MSAEIESKSIKGTKWAVIFFYVFIVFEFLYMASPVAVYFYSVYNPGLDLFGKIPGAVWLTGFFLPHIVEDTSCVLINLHNSVGAIFVLVGFLSFLAGAIHVYSNKLFKKGAVTGGMYKYIRHPQYASFIMISIGMLFLWPRYLVLLMFITVLFVYYFLARYEEKECERKFGTVYNEYKNKTNMFFPFTIFKKGKVFTLPVSGLKRGVTVGLLYLASVLVSLGFARILHHLSIDSLDTRFVNNSLFIAITGIEQNTFDEIIKTALKDDNVKGVLHNVDKTGNSQFLSYVLPGDMYISEIPMSMENVIDRDHFLAGTELSSNNTIFKIIFTIPIPINNSISKDKNILLNTYSIDPAFEVWVDTEKKEVIKVIQLPKDKRYGHTPVPVY